MAGGILLKPHMKPVWAQPGLSLLWLPQEGSGFFFQGPTLHTQTPLGAVTR